MQRIQRALENIFDDPTELFIGIVLAVVSAFVLGAASRFVSAARRWLSPLFWEAIAALGTFPVFRYLALQAYKHRIAAEHGQLTNVYLERAETLDLRQVFVPLSLTSQAPRAMLHRQRRAALGAPQSTLEVLEERDNRRLVILGPPGSGKTTMLRALASGVSRQQWTDHDELVPVFVALRAYAREAKDRSLADWIVQHCFATNGLRNGHVMLEYLIRENRLLLLLDGLDEVTDVNVNLVSRRIIAFLVNSDVERRALIVLTCREQNFPLLKESEFFVQSHFRQYRLAELRESELEEMVAQRKRDFEYHVKSSEAFLKTVRAQPSVTDLHRNPLLLTLSISLYLNRFDDAVPSTLFEFYDESIRHLLNRRNYYSDAESEAANEFTTRDKYDLLREFALSSLEKAGEAGRDFEEFPLTELVAKARLLARDRLNIKEDDADRLVREIHLKAGLIDVLQDRDTFTYAHRSIHEFCAALCLSGFHEAGLERIKLRLADSEWRQTITYYCSIDAGQGEQIVNELLGQAFGANNKVDVAKLRLATECATVLPEPKVDLRLRVIGNLTTVLGTENGRHVLVPLLNLGREAPDEVKVAVTNALQRIIAFEDPLELARELNRLDNETALSVLDFMARKTDEKYQRAALSGVLGLDGIERIRLLWDLLDSFESKHEPDCSSEARRALLQLMERDGAVELLNNECRPLTQELEQDEVDSVYPFTPKNQRPSNLATLLVLEARASKDQPPRSDWLVHENAWRSLVNASTVPKQPNLERFWRRVAVDRSRMVLSVTTRTIGLGLFYLGVVGGLATIGTLWLQGRTPTLGQVVLVAVALTAVPLGLILWPLWNDVGSLAGWINKYGGLPTFLQFAFSEHNQVSRARESWAERSLSVAKTRRVVTSARPSSGGQVNSGLRALSRVAVCSLLVGLLPFSMVLLLGGEFANLVDQYVVVHPGLRVVTGDDTGNIRVRDAETGVLVGERRYDAARILDNDASPDGMRIVSIYDDGRVLLWDRVENRSTNIAAEVGHVQSIAFSPDGETVLTGSVDGTARAWEIATGRQTGEFQPHDGRVLCVAFSPDGTVVATGSEDRTVMVWDTATEQQIHVLRGHYGPVQDIAFSPDGRFLITGSEDRTARIWDLSDGRLVRELVGHRNFIRTVVFGPKGRLALTGGDDRRILLWDVSTAQRLVDITGHRDFVRRVSFINDGREIVSDSDDGTVRIWDAMTGKAKAMVAAHAADVGALSVIVSDSRHYVSESKQETAGAQAAVPWSLVRPELSRWGWSGYIAWLFFASAFLFFLSSKTFDPGRRFYLRSPNPYLPLYDLANIEQWLPSRR